MSPEFGATTTVFPLAVPGTDIDLSTEGDDIPPAVVGQDPIHETQVERDLRALRERLDSVERQLAAERAKPQKMDVASKPEKSKLPSVNWTGQLQVDTVFSDQSEANRAAVGDAPNGTDFRRARLGAYGKYQEWYEYRIEMDFALPGRPSFLDVWVGHQNVPFFGNVKVGHFFEPFSLERLSANRFSTFLERGLADAMAPARNTGIASYNSTESERLMWQYGFFKSGSDNYGDDVGDSPDWAFTHRIVWAPGFEKSNTRYLNHFGFAHSFRQPDDRLYRISSTPEIRLNEQGVASMPNFVDTGNIPTNTVDLLNFEMAFVRGPLSFQTEYNLAIVDQTNGPTAKMHGAYAFFSWFVTGEHRPYATTTSPDATPMGMFGRPIPKTNVLPAPGSTDVPPGPGAWELAARWSWIDLTDAGINGGDLHDLTFGVNWYLNPYAKMQFNYILPVLRKPGFGESNANFVGVRVNWDF
jgi:phosphate-selective porin OprO/OprP